MPNWKTHLEVGNKLQKTLDYSSEDFQLFLLGSVLPDINNCYIVKNISVRFRHHHTHYSDDETPSYLKFESQFLSEMKKSPLVYGYYAHLFTDYFWNNDYYTKIKERGLQDEDHTLLRIRKQDDFKVYNNKTKLTKEIEVDDLNFILGVDLFKREKIYFLNIGLPVVDENTISERFKFDFILQLKQRKIIDAYDWFILFDDKFDKGDDVIKAEELSNLNPIIVIGAAPHYYNSKKFYESQLLKTYSNLYYWSINFKDVYLYTYSDDGEKTKTSISVETVDFYLDDIMIYGPMYYINIVKRQFFSKYSACKSQRDPEYKFYCEKSDEFGINELKLFPILYLDNAFLNYTFELTYKELFIEMNGKYHFLVTENEDESWSIGYSLLKKYQFVFNQDSKTIGFYNPNLPIEKEEDTTDAKEKEKENEKEKEKENEKGNKKKEKKENENDKNNVNNLGISIEMVILIAVLCAIVFLLIGILVGQFIFKKLKGKKRANELDENYDYIAPQINPINDN